MQIMTQLTIHCEIYWLLGLWDSLFDRRHNTILRQFSIALYAVTIFDTIMIYRM